MFLTLALIFLCAPTIGMDNTPPSVAIKDTFDIDDAYKFLYGNEKDNAKQRHQRNPDNAQEDVGKTLKEKIQSHMKNKPAGFTIGQLRYLLATSALIIIKKHSREQ